MEGHEGHHVSEWGPDAATNGRQYCFDCGVLFIACKKPAEYVQLTLEIPPNVEESK